MANCITPKLLDAINALNIKQFESRETRSLEELLDPHDWRLVEVLKFRQRIKDAERNNEQHTINSIKRSFEKYKLTLIIIFCFIALRTFVLHYTITINPCGSIVNVAMIAMFVFCLGLAIGFILGKAND